MQVRGIRWASLALLVWSGVGCVQPRRVAVALPDWNQRYGALRWELSYWDGSAVRTARAAPGSDHIEIVQHGLRGASGTVVVAAWATRDADGYVLPPVGAWSDSGAAYLAADRLHGPVARIALEVAARGIDVARLHLDRLQASVLAVTDDRPDLLDTDRLRTAIGRGTLAKRAIARLPTAVCHTTIDALQHERWLVSEPLEPALTTTPAGPLRHVVVTVPHGGARQLWYTGAAAGRVRIWRVVADREGRCTWLDG